MPARTLEREGREGDLRTRGRSSRSATRTTSSSTIERHIGAFVVGIGAGLGIGLGYNDLYEGLSLGLGVIGVAELIILTRPGTTITAPRSAPPSRCRTLHVSPWADKYARGIGVVGQF